MANGKKILVPSRAEGMETPAPSPVTCRCQDYCCTPSSWSADFGKKVLWTLGGVFLVYLIFLVGTLTRNNLKKFHLLGWADQMERTVTVAGLGKVAGSNDIAVTTLGYFNTDKDIAKAQADNKKVMDGVMAELKKMGVADKDLQTNYSIYPDYNYTEDKGQELKGYRVSHSVTVKIRDLAKIPAVLGLAGKYGANEVGGLSFTIDDPENLKAEARDKAWADAGAKAERLAGALGVRLVSVVSYYEQDMGEFPQPMPMFRADGLGGGGEAALPTVASGSREVAVQVSITYKMLPR